MCRQVEHVSAVRFNGIHAIIWQVKDTVVSEDAGKSSVTFSEICRLQTSNYLLEMLWLLSTSRH